MDIPDFRLVIILLLLFVSAFFSGSETAIFSFGRLGVSKLKHEKHKWAVYFDKLLQKPGKLLATILLGNELTNVMIATITASLFSHYYGSSNWRSAVFFSVVVTTPLLLLFGEITPKAIAIKTPRQFSLIVVRPIYLLFKIIEPVLNFIDKLFKPVKKLFGIDDSNLKTISERSFLGIVDASSEELKIESMEREIIHNIFKFSDKTVQSIMIPLEKVFYIREDSSLTAILDGVRTTGFSRIPVLEKEGFGIKGILLSKDLLPYINPIDGEALAEFDASTLTSSLLEPVISISGKSKLYNVFRMLKIKKMHIAVVVEEHGNMIGVLTMEDLLEELFGEISDERDI